MIVFVNGNIGFGSPAGGRDYWGKSFVAGAVDYFKDDDDPFFSDVRYKLLSSALKRYTDGDLYACESQCKALLSARLPLRFVSHSMGGAFACGMMEALALRGVAVDAAVFLNAYQPEGCKILFPAGVRIIDYRNTDDPILNICGIGTKGAGIPHATQTLREKSGRGLLEIHKYPITSRSGFWSKL